MPFSATAVFPSRVAGAADLLNHINFTQGETAPTLAASIGAVDTSFTCASGTGVNLPTDNFEVTLDSEIIFVSLRTGDVCSGLVRAVEGTVAASHASGVSVNAFITALAHNQLAAEVGAIEAALGANANGVLRIASVTLTAAQLKSLSTAPATIIPAPGAGKSIVPVSAEAVYNFGTVPFNVNPISTWFAKLGYDTTGVAPFYNVANINALSASATLGVRINVTSKSAQPFTSVVPNTLGQNMPPDNRALQLFNFFIGSGALLGYVNAGAPAGFSIVAGGAGFAVNDIFTLTPPQGNPARFTVTGVDSNGAVTSFSRITNTNNASMNAYFYTPQHVSAGVVNPSVGQGLLIKITSLTLGLNGIAASNVTAGQGGTGYNIGDTGTIAPNSGGSGTQTATYTVTAVLGGAVTGYTITATGTGYIVAGGVATAKTTGAGSGFQIDITATGGGYAPGDTGTWGTVGTGGSYTVGTVDANGNILTFSSLVFPTASASPNNNAALATRGGAQPGVGTGLMFNATLVSGMDPTVGDGTVTITVAYYIV